MPDLRLREDAKEAAEIADAFRAWNPATADDYKAWLRETADLYGTTQTDLKACVVQHGLSFEDNARLERERKKRMEEASRRSLYRLKMVFFFTALVLVVLVAIFSLWASDNMPEPSRIERGAEALCRTVKCE